MSRDTGESIVSHLRDLGLTEYEARCFVALSRVDTATASEISEVSDLPRTRVYDTAERLQERGLVEIQDGSPRLFRAVSPDRARSLLEADYQRSLDRAIEDLESIPDIEGRERHGVWTVRGRENIDERLHELCKRAERELYVSWASDKPITENHVEWLRAAADRGATVKFVSSTEETRELVAEAVPEAQTRGPLVEMQSLPSRVELADLADGTETSVELFEEGYEFGQLGWIAMADRAAVMVATAGDPIEGFWAEGTDNGVVILIGQLIGIVLDFVDTFGPETVTEKLDT